MTRAWTHPDRCCALRRAFVSVIALAVMLAALGMTGCKGEAGPATGSQGEYRIVATTSMVADVVRRVAGERAAVQGLMGEGIDPHLYKPTRNDIAAIGDADVIFYNGLLLEGRMIDALVRAGTAGKKVYAVTQQIDPSYLLEPAEFEGKYDPHVWMDPQAWSQAVAVVRDALIEHDPPGRDLYTANADALLSEIEQLDAYTVRVLSSVPEDRRVLVTAHDAFNYFGKRYGYEVLGIQGLSTESEAGVQDIERLVDLLVARQIPAVFVESTVSQQNIAALIDGARARGHAVRIGGELFSDAMGESGTYEGTYVGMIDHNVTTIVRALGGEAPAKGLQGKLAPHAP
ncbi:MAG: zinc ABC transporter substrate-binding protein [Planctomycetota bacterium]